jgi:hypothetical protein
MSQRRSPLSSLLVLAVLFAAVWLYFTPYLAMNRLQTAARAGDTAAMNELVDFPALRESVKQNVRGAVEGAAGRRSNPLGVLGGLLVGAVAGPVVDAVVTPQGIAQLTQGQRPGHHDDSSASFRDEAHKLKVKRGYEGVDRFVVHFVDRDSGHERMALVMRRDGIIHWRLSAVRLPGASGS